MHEKERARGNRQWKEQGRGTRQGRDQGRRDVTDWDSEQGHNQKKWGTWRRDHGWRERSKFRTRSGHEKTVRLDTTTISLEKWKTPLPRDTRKER